MPKGIYNRTVPVSEATKLKRSNSLKGRIFSDETRKKISLAKKGKAGRVQTDIVKSKIAKTLTGIKRSDEFKAKMSVIAKNRVGSACSNYKDGRYSDKTYVNWLKNSNKRRKRIIKELLGGHTFEDWEFIKKLYRHTCPSCHKKEPDIKLTEDHIIPISKFGSDLIENIQPLCQSCNSIKNNKTIFYGSNCRFIIKARLRIISRGTTMGRHQNIL